jgi:hypothetical protein
VAKVKTKRRRDPLAGLDKATADLYRAVQNYVKAHDGSVIVIGGIDLVQMPGDGEMKYRVAVRCLGKRPVFREGE